MRRKRKEKGRRLQKGNLLRLSAAALLTVCSLAAGLLMPEIAAVLLDQKTEGQKDTFESEEMQLTSSTDLADMLLLVSRRGEEVYLNDGIARSREEILSDARRILTRLQEAGIGKNQNFDDLSADAFLAAYGTYSSAAWGYDDSMSESGSPGSTGDKLEEAAGQKSDDNRFLMGVIWRCSCAGSKDGEYLELLLDDRTGQLLSFTFSPGKSNREQQELYIELTKSPDLTEDRILEIMKEKTEWMERFCQESYGFLLNQTEYHIEDTNRRFFAAVMDFKDEEGREIQLILEIDLNLNEIRFN